MDAMRIYQIIESELAEKFWTEVNEESPLPVEFIDAAICFAALSELSNQQNTGIAAQT
ncbi:MAG: hypothetical protein GF372_04070 [Candidatus Marinimicrobia bacterium]|nr:hypothetical protein [Candidatus Neomarinimicrobiota bacterium]